MIVKLSTGNCCQIFSKSFATLQETITRQVIKRELVHAQRAIHENALKHLDPNFYLRLTDDVSISVMEAFPSFKRSLPSFSLPFPI